MDIQHDAPFAQREIEPVTDPAYWKARLDACDGEIHRAIFNGSIDQWNPLVEQQKEILAQEIQPYDTILDAGCGWGRLLDLLPDDWNGMYLGVDISPEFIDLARKTYLNHEFIITDLRSLPFCEDKEFDVAVCCSMSQMIIRNCGQEYWDQILKELNRVAKRIISLGFEGYD